MKNQPKSWISQLQTWPISARWMMVAFSGVLTAAFLDTAWSISGIFSISAACFATYWVSIGSAEPPKNSAPTPKKPTAPRKVKSIADQLPVIANNSTTFLIVDQDMPNLDTIEGFQNAHTHPVWSTALLLKERGFDVRFIRSASRTQNAHHPVRSQLKTPAFKAIRMPGQLINLN